MTHPLTEKILRSAKLDHQIDNIITDYLREKAEEICSDEHYDMKFLKGDAYKLLDLPTEQTLRSKDKRVKEIFGELKLMMGELYEMWDEISPK